LLAEEAVVLTLRFLPPAPVLLVVLVAVVVVRMVAEQLVKEPLVKAMLVRRDMASTLP
jgi:hypothetical protein